MAIVDIADIPDFLHTAATWEEYEELLKATQDRRLRITYDRGQLEIVAPSRRHEKRKGLLGRILEALLDHRRIPYDGAGSLTMRRRILRRGLDPDECYWIAHCAEMSGHEEYDPERDPPPDLVVEIDVSRSSINRLGIYAALGVPEVWRYAKDRRLTVYRLDEQGAYRTCDRSPTFPDFPLDVVERFVAMGLETNKAQAVWAFQDWLRESR